MNMTLRETVIAVSIVLIVASIVVGSVFAARGGRAETVPFERVVPAGPTGADDCLIKLTYLGPRIKPLRSLVFGTYETKSAEMFVPYHRPDVSYKNDEMVSPAGFSVTREEMLAIFRALRRERDLVRGEDPPSPVVSMMILCGARTPAPRVFETLVGYDKAGYLLDEIIYANLDPEHSEPRRITRFWSKNVGGNLP